MIWTNIKNHNLRMFTLEDSMPKHLLDITSVSFSLGIDLIRSFPIPPSHGTIVSVTLNLQCPSFKSAARYKAQYTIRHFIDYRLFGKGTAASASSKMPTVCVYCDRQVVLRVEIPEDSYLSFLDRIAPIDKCMERREFFR